jgi:SAM-dependent methyltransferase
MMRSFAARSTEAEQMDSETASAACLDDLAFVNRLTMVHHPTVAWVRHALRQMSCDASLLDVACGYGDGLRLLRRKFPHLGLAGIDLNITPARAAAQAGEPIELLEGDVFTLDRQFDLVVATQFTHHLDRGMLVRYLRWAEAHSRIGWFICDLHRHIVPWLFIKALPRLVRLDPMVAHDGPISVARGFVRRDWEEALADAGIRGAEIRWFVFRWRIGRLK